MLCATVARSYGYVCNVIRESGKGFLVVGEGANFPRILFQVISTRRVTLDTPLYLQILFSIFARNPVFMCRTENTLGR